MHSSMNFVQQSLELHLFFARIMKEHSFFLQLGFTPRDASFTQQANSLRMNFDRLLADVVSLSNGVVNQEVLASGEVITPYTLNAEMATIFYTGIQIPTEITKVEAGLMGGDGNAINPVLEQRVAALNQRAMDLIASLIQFKTTILSNVLSCKMFTINYPLLIEHILREARLYLRMVQRIQNREMINLRREALEQEAFWNRIMAEHSKFIRGLLDPTENELFLVANNFGNEFDQLTAEALAAMDMTIPFEKVTEDSLMATRRIRGFKAQATQGLLDCEIRSIIIPLLGDHTLREANHYLRLLRMFSRFD
jgi:hypothetical protein